MPDIDNASAFISGLLQIILINIILSGDNAVVIGMAAHRLEPAQRRTAILVGGIGAIVLRVVLTVVAAALLMVPGLRLVGGLLLVWIAFQLLEEEETSEESHKAATTLREAITTILIADLVMSIDNVLGVAAASNGNYVLLGIGLVVSMAILMFLGGLIANLIDKFWWLAYVGSGVIAWTAAELILSDPFLEKMVELPQAAEYAFGAVVTAATIAFAHWFHRMRGKEAAHTSAA